METKIAKAIEAFYNGRNCAQSVLCAYLDTLHFDEPQAMAMALGFGGGMGKMQTTCGAVTGAYMVMGLRNTQVIDDELVRKKETPRMMQLFRDRFRGYHQTDQCVHLIGCDLRTVAGRQYFKDHHLKDKVCSKCITSAISILEDLFKIE
ncbi:MULTISPECIES: C-GCAxxG-C-C family protein [unclassified Carboxylicivirga]|uniref:C-GCAxxG-C-C family protein n=1 Tax=Carboxylicivirga TaxID=1628153 RepID=UPI003D33A8BD